LRQCALLC